MPESLPAAAANLPTVVLQRDAIVENTSESSVAVAEAWANLIGWKLFGFICFGLLIGQLNFGLATAFPPWVLLALTGAGLGGRELANIIIGIFVGAGEAAKGAQNANRARGRRS